MYYIYLVKRYNNKSGRMDLNTQSKLHELLAIYSQREERYQQRLEDFELMRRDVSAVEEPRINKIERNIKIAIATPIVLVIALIALNW